MLREGGSKSDRKPGSYWAGTWGLDSLAEGGASQLYNNDSGRGCGPHHDRFDPSECVFLDVEDYRTGRSHREYG